MKSELSASVGTICNIITKMVQDLKSAGSADPDSDLHAILFEERYASPCTGAILYALMMELVFLHREESGSVMVALRPIRDMSFEEVRTWLGLYGYRPGSIKWAMTISKDEFRRYWRINESTKDNGRLISLEDSEEAVDGCEVDFIHHPSSGWLEKKREVLRGVWSNDFVIATRDKEHVIYL